MFLSKEMMVERRDSIAAKLVAVLVADGTPAKLGAVPAGVNFSRIELSDNDDIRITVAPIDRCRPHHPGAVVHIDDVRVRIINRGLSADFVEKFGPAHAGFKLTVNPAADLVLAQKLQPWAVKFNDAEARFAVMEAEVGEQTKADQQARDRFYSILTGLGGGPSSMDEGSIHVSPVTVLQLERKGDRVRVSFDIGLSDMDPAVSAVIRAFNEMEK